MSLCDWDSLGFVKDWITAFVNGASDRWAYHLLAELPALEGPEASAEMIAAEIRRLVDRSEKQTKELLAPDEPARAGHRTAQLYEEYLKRMQGRASPDAVGTRGEIVGRATRDFVTLAQSASFLARGRDR